jgi:hypothetical protein
MLHSQPLGVAVDLLIAGRFLKTFPLIADVMMTAVV